MDPSFRVGTWPEGANSLPPDAALLRQFKKQGSFNPRMPLWLMRGLVHLATRWMAPRLYRGRFHHQYLRLPAQGRQIGLRIVRPAGSDTLPAVLYVHGGGGVLTRSASYLRVLKNIAFAAKTAVVAVDYRRGPEHPFPAGLDDAAATLQWIHDNAFALKLDPQRISVAGDSAGGNIAAGLLLRNRDRFQLPVYKQILINARLTHIRHFPSIDAFGEGYGITRNAIEFFSSKYFSSPSSSRNAYASPLDAPDHRGLPSALIITSEYDPLRDEGEAYAAALHQAGVPVKAVRFAGMAHTMVVFGATRSAASHAMQLIAEALR